MNGPRVRFRSVADLGTHHRVSPLRARSGRRAMDLRGMQTILHERNAPGTLCD